MLDCLGCSEGSIINPKQFANYAKALGEDIKDDKIDARVLADAITLAKPNQIKVPSFNKDVEHIKVLINVKDAPKR